MKRILTLTTALTMFGATTAFAAPMPDVMWPVPNVASEKNVTQELRELGFDNISHFEHSGGVIQAIATWEGEFVALHIEEDNGRITERHHPRVERLNLAADAEADDAAIIAALEDRGYEVIGEIDRRDTYYVVEVERLDTPSYVYIEPGTGDYIDTAMVDRPSIPVVDEWTEDYLRAQLTALGFDNVDVGGISGEMAVAQGYENGTPVTISVDKQTGAVYVRS